MRTEVHAARRGASKTNRVLRWRRLTIAQSRIHNCLIAGAAFAHARSSDGGEKSGRMKSPYSKLHRRAYWRSGVVERHALQAHDLYWKKFGIRPNEQIFTAGSCFAQHIARRLRQNGYHVLDAEPAPPMLDLETAQNFGFSLYSARYGNIYTVRQMLQLVQECQGTRTPIDRIWQKDGRFFDALRPSIEPNGLARADLVIAHRDQHLKRVKSLISRMTLCIFTMGLTETWEHVEDGTVYPTAPGVIAGDSDSNSYRFKNLSYPENLDDFLRFRELCRSYNPSIRFILTVSPVPLTATAANEHVLSATTYSKSVLRAVAGYLSQRYDDIDYFPSYEIVASPPTRGFFYENNMRSVAAAGVDVVMAAFFEQHGNAASTPGDLAAEDEQVAFADPPVNEAVDSQKVYCDELLLDAFAP